MNKIEETKDKSDFLPCKETEMLGVNVIGRTVIL